MVKTQNLVPEIYYKESRDFQYFGRLFDIIFNYCKTNTDLLKKLSYKSQSNMIDLVLQTLGFKPEYNSKIDSLYQLSLVWSKLIKNKGNITSIKTIIYSLLNYEGISSSATIDYVPSGQSYEGEAPVNYNQLKLLFSSEVKNDEIYLIEKVLDYILPVTVVYQIKTAKVENQTISYIIHNDYAEVDEINLTDRIANDSEDIINRNKINESANTPLDTITENKLGDLRVSAVAKDEK